MSNANLLRGLSRGYPNTATESVTREKRMGKPTVILVATMGEVHPHHVKAGLTELVDRLNGVGLGANGADNGRPAQVALRRDLGVKRSQPFNLAAEAQVVESGRHSDGADVILMVM